MEFTSPKGDYLSAELCVARSFADVFALNFEINRNRRVRRIGPQPIGGLCGDQAKGQRENKHSSFHSKSIAKIYLFGQEVGSPLRHFRLPIGLARRLRNRTTPPEP